MGLSQAMHGELGKDVTRAFMSLRPGPDVSASDSEKFGKLREMPFFKEFGEVDSIDGFVMALSPWVVRNLRFDESLGQLHGYDFDSTMLRIGSMNMLLHGVENPDIRYRDSLAQSDKDDAERFTLVLANPPFAGSLDYESTAKDLLQVVKTKKTELLFLALFLRLRGEAVDPVGEAPVPFDELITPAGATGLRGFPEGRLRGRSGDRAAKRSIATPLAMTWTRPDGTPSLSSCRAAAVELATTPCAQR